MQRAIIHLKCGSVDHVDPVLSVKETDKMIIIDNGYYQYEFKKSVVRNYEIVEIERKPDSERIE